MKGTVPTTNWLTAEQAGAKEILKKKENSGQPAQSAPKTDHKGKDRSECKKEEQQENKRRLKNRPPDGAKVRIGKEECKVVVLNNGASNFLDSDGKRVGPETWKKFRDIYDLRDPNRSQDDNGKRHTPPRRIAS